MTSTLGHSDEGLHSALRGFFAEDTPDHIAVAISGGSDSLGLLSLLHAWSKEGGPQISAVTVDHGLRPESDAEAMAVANACSEMGVPHNTLRWTRAQTSGNVHDQARRARYAMMAGWAKTKSIPVIVLGHTLDDQAETFMMRLARGAGVDGLAAMRATWTQNDVAFARPLLTVRREALRDHLRARHLSWIEDSANSDPAYERSRVREALPALGITSETLATVAAHLAEARNALNAATLDTARKIARIEDGDVVIDREGFDALSHEISRRLLLRSLQWISGADYPPRSSAMKNLQSDIAAGRNATLQGCDFSHSQGTIRITREAEAVANTLSVPGELWDSRWRVTGPNLLNARIARLGEAGLRHCPNRADAPLPARSLIATPAVWQGRKLIAAPLAGLSNGWSATLVMRPGQRPCDDFAAQISH